MKLLIGLGNPGVKYQNTRHNIGFRMVEAFARSNHGTWNQTEKFKGLTCKLQTTSCLLIKPQTFMNLSGESIQQFVHFYKLNPEEDLLICYDDKDLMFGTLRERSEGSSGGHNGIKSLITHLGTQKFHRLKFGIGHQDQKIPTDAFVLQKFSEEEEQQIPILLEQTTKKIQTWLSKDNS